MENTDTSTNDAPEPDSGKNILLFTPPAYLELSWGDPISLISFVFFQALILVFLHVPLTYFKGLQEQILASMLVFYPVNHIIGTFLGFFLGFPISILIFLVSLVFTRNEKFYTLFSSLGSSYVIIYLIMILFQMTSFVIPASTFMILFIGLVISKKVNRVLHAAICLSIFTGWCILTLISNLSPGDFVRNAHFSGYVQGVSATIIFLVVFAASFLWTLYKEEVKMKYHEFREGRKNSGDSKEDEGKKEDNDKE